MTDLTYKDLLDAGVHFGHLTRKWDPHMAPYIFMERNGIHIIDLNKTLVALEEASNAIRAVVRSGRKVLFVATKKQAKSIVEEEAVRLRMPYVTERWLGGMLTNFTTIRKSLKKLASIEKQMKDESYMNLAKRERLMIAREKDKLIKVLGGISDLTRLPAAIFVVDVRKEHIAVKEAQKLNIPIFAIVDTNSNPNVADFPIPANDDAYKSIDIIVRQIARSVEEGLLERKKDKEELKLKQEEEEKRQMDEGTHVDEPTVAEKAGRSEGPGEEKPREKSGTVKASSDEEKKKEGAGAKETRKAEKPETEVKASAKEKTGKEEQPKAEKTAAKEEPKEEKTASKEEPKADSEAKKKPEDNPQEKTVAESEAKTKAGADTSAEGGPSAKESEEVEETADAENADKK